MSMRMPLERLMDWRVYHSLKNPRVKDYRGSCVATVVGVEGHVAKAEWLAQKCLLCANEGLQQKKDIQMLSSMLASDLEERVEKGGG